MKTFRYHAAVARVTHEPSGLSVVSYSGPMNEASFTCLRALVIPEVQHSKVLLVDTRAVLALGGNARIDVDTFAGGYSPPAAVLAQPALAALWMDYAQQAAARGIMRAVFSEMVHAQDWVQRLMGQDVVHSSVSLPPARLETPEKNGS